MRDYFCIGSTPWDEPCAQVGEEDYRAKAPKECRRFENAESCARREAMGLYSPKIKDQHIARLYLLARLKKIPMTHLVNQFVEEGLNREEAIITAVVEGTKKVIAQPGSKREPMGESAFWIA